MLLLEQKQIERARHWIINPFVYLDASKAKIWYRMFAVCHCGYNENVLTIFIICYFIQRFVKQAEKKGICFHGKFGFFLSFWFLLLFFIYFSNTVANRLLYTM